MSVVEVRPQVIYNAIPYIHTYIQTGQSSIINICYPAIIITGMPKCGTSAMYDLLSRFPGTDTVCMYVCMYVCMNARIYIHAYMCTYIHTGAVVMQEKENCPSIRRRPHWVYFNSLPRMVQCIRLLVLCFT